ncbi:hypothetical protein EYF80_002398 [Liparis tanakae]|uniref:Uncharacterized protein n=1 Tax=Liparis tanakae TaxID=230148 RepID=A0A4Z2JAK5_9TELE|nr:hypothetical protein EYF80_002398 [Liparis tanakae]
MAKGQNLSASDSCRMAEGLKSEKRLGEQRRDEAHKSSTMSGQQDNTAPHRLKRRVSDEEPLGSRRDKENLIT